MTAEHFHQPAVFQVPASGGWSSGSWTVIFDNLTGEILQGIAQNLESCTYKNIICFSIRGSIQFATNMCHQEK